MENHPIPQDVTGFQFKLVGNMTIKQFAYLAISAVIGWIIYSLPISLLISLPTASLLVGAGASLAFLPIEGRPMDTMILHFVHALFAPNQYVYQKMGGHIAIFTIPAQSVIKTAVSSSQPSERLQEYLSGLKKQPKNELDQKEEIFLNSVSTLFLPQQTQPPIVPQPSQLQETESPPPPIPVKDKPHIISIELAAKKEARKNQSVPVSPPPAQTAPAVEKKKDDELENETKILKQQLEFAKKIEAMQSQSANTKDAHQKTIDLQNQLNSLLSQKSQLEKQLIAMAQKLEKKQQPVYTPTAAKAMAQTQSVRIIPKGMGPKYGLPIAIDAPNLITGIVKDPRGNILPNILVEVKDKDGNPIRAFKTNNLGQFASATQLSNGVYTVSFEDPQGAHKFDSVEIAVTGNLISPLEVISTDARENLRKELFGT